MNIGSDPRGANIFVPREPRYLEQTTSDYSTQRSSISYISTLMKRNPDFGDGKQRYLVNSCIYQISCLDGTAGGSYSIRQISCNLDLADTLLSPPPEGRRHYPFNESQHVEDPA